MHVGEITFTFDAGHDDDAALGAIHGLCHALRLNGQIVGREFPLSRVKETYRVTVMLPAADSLAARYAREWVRRAQDSLREAGQRRQRVRVLGESPDALNPGAHEDRSSLILFTTYISLESCLRCGDCFNPVPLYSVPPLRDEEFCDVMAWQSDYQACDQLQMNCATGERFGMRELGRVDSSLTRRGRSICRALESSTGVPVFYYLHRSYRRTFEREHRCPGCGGQWLLDERRHGRFDFRCEPCRLFSNLVRS